MLNSVSFEELDLLDVGNRIQLYGAIYSGGGMVFLIPLPDENPTDLWLQSVRLLRMDEHQMEQFLRQTDVLDTRGPGKAILRKSQRQIDQTIAWKVFERDGYRCRYCGEKRPLTVDHLDLWEDGGVTVADNLLSACRRCNKLRGRMPYRQWLTSREYASVNTNLPVAVAAMNISAQTELARLEGMRVARQRSR